MKKQDIRKYYFSETVANEVGLEEAILFSNIYFWVNKNRNDNDDDHFHEGRYWMYYTVIAFVEQYPFWTISMVKRMLKKLKVAGYIETGVFNRFGYDKTKWYTVTNKGYAVIEGNNGTAEIDNWISEE